jgi:hypothetical protein
LRSPHTIHHLHSQLTEEEAMTSNKIWNTGVDLNGQQLKTGKVDPHWRVIQGPGITNPQSAYVVTDQRLGNYFQTTDSRWIWANSLGRGDTTGDTALPYVFQTEFLVEVDLSQHWIQINGKWGADNFGQFTIDRAPLPPGSGGGEISLLPGNVATNYRHTHDFSISQAHFLSLSHLRLSAGWHTFEVWVHNEGSAGASDPSVNPAGFNLSALRIDINSVRRVPPGVHP